MEGMADMTVNDLVEKFDLQVVAGENGLESPVQAGYCGDLLSDVMGNAPMGCVWLTIQAHQNIIAVAVLREMAAIIITGDTPPLDDTKDKANAEGIPILQWSGSSYDLAGRLYAGGLSG